LHNFGATSTDGTDPVGSVILSGSTFYGMTNDGGADGEGMIFSYNLNTEVYTDLHDFGSVTDDGDVIAGGGLLLVNNTLYGMTEQGGIYDGGVIFALTVPVPEPSSLCLLGLAAGGLLLSRRRRHSRIERSFPI
jgi:uncharacterized repeat protein (TIGR03803 family)